MEKLGARHWLGALALALPALLFLPGIGFETTEPTALARRSSAPPGWFYRVRAGDSLSTIAERELGTFKRYKEILALNPGIQPRSLPVGNVLRMPPRVPGSAPVAVAETEPPKSPESNRLLLSIAGLLGLVLLIVLVAGRLERRAYERSGG